MARKASLVVIGNQRLAGVSGFALRELLAIVSVIALVGTLFSTWQGAFGRARDGIRCLTNGRQMMRAFALYAEDYAGLLPPNEDVLTQAHNWIAVHASSLPDATNRTAMGNPRINLLAPYATAVSIWKCPADRTTVSVGVARAPTVRSVSMNNAVGTVCPQFPASHVGAPVLPTHGAWLDGNHGHVRGSKFRTFGRENEFVLPAETFVFIDEHPPSLNDGVFGHPGYNPQNTTLSTIRWVDFPAEYHGRAAGVTFADGHAEMHRWTGLQYGRSPTFPASSVLPQQRADWEWIALHTTQPLR
jgi:prepilin-type processing-associated H-X9-DG protein